MSDFSGCGLDTQDSLVGLDDEVQRAFWDKWVAERVCERRPVPYFEWPKTRKSRRAILRSD